MFCICIFSFYFFRSLIFSERSAVFPPLLHHTVIVSGFIIQLTVSVVMIFSYHWCYSSVFSVLCITLHYPEQQWYGVKNTIVKMNCELFKVVFFFFIYDRVLTVKHVNYTDERQILCDRGWKFATTLIFLCHVFSFLATLVDNKLYWLFFHL